MEYKCFIFQLVLVLSSCSRGSSRKHKCESLSFRTGVDIQCESPTTKEFLDCQSGHVPFGTIAKYKCEDFFVANDGEKEGGEMRCSENGQWTPERKFRAFSCHMECGKSYPESTNTKWPWHVGIFARESHRATTSFKFACGGTLINPFNAELLILTGTECLRNRNLEDIEIRMGGFSALTNDKLPNTGQAFSAKRIIFEEDGLLALIQLSRQPLPTKNILPACLNLNFNFAKYQVQASALGQMVGFGNQTDEGADILRAVSLEVVPLGKCLDKRSRIISKHSFCAGSEEGSNVCNGDFGGGLLFPTYFANSEKYFIQGVFGDGIRTCKHYGWFTGLSDYADWIRQTALTLHEEASLQESGKPTDMAHTLLEFDILNNAVKSVGQGPAMRLPVMPEQISSPKPTRLPVSEEIPSVMTVTNLGDYRAAGVEVHNFYRRWHGVPPVKLSLELSQAAQVEADVSLITNRYKFEGFTNWYGLSGRKLSSRRLVQEAIRDWYKTSSSYNWDQPRALPFTQIIWKRTTEIGIGVSQRGAKQVVVVTYNRPLIISSEKEKSFRENVLRPVKLES